MLAYRHAKGSGSNRQQLGTAMDLEKIKKLIEFVGTSRVSELTVSEHGTTVRITREGSKSAPAPQQPTAAVQDVAEPADMPVVTPASAVAAQSKTISAPSFGLFHRAPSPGAPPFVEVGHVIEQGQELFIIEAMKVFNTVKADRGGKVVGILANDGEDVELGQPILELE